MIQVQLSLRPRFTRCTN